MTGQGVVCVRSHTSKMSSHLGSCCCRMCQILQFCSLSNDSSDQDSVDILVQSPSLDAIDEVFDEEMQKMLLISFKNRQIASLQRGSKNTNMMTLIT